MNWTVKPGRGVQAYGVEGEVHSCVLEFLGDLRGRSIHPGGLIYRVVGPSGGSLGVCGQPSMPWGLDASAEQEYGGSAA